MSLEGCRFLVVVLLSLILFAKEGSAELPLYPENEYFSPGESVLGFSSPDGLALDSQKNRLFVSEETRSVISVIQSGRREVVIDGSTPVYVGGRKADGLMMPEGIAWSSQDESLWVVEDRPGGRVIQYDLSHPSRISGQVIHIPGSWGSFAWEGIDVSQDGEIVLCGSDAESLNLEEGATLPSGVILFRDQEQDWWIPMQRLFASFSSVAFGPDARRVVYTCELTGEIGWLDVESRKSIGATANIDAVNPEGVCMMPDGTFLVAEERGTLLRVDPGLNLVQRIYEGPNNVESLLWDEVRQTVWLTDDSSGQVLPLVMKNASHAVGNALDFAVYYPVYSPKTVPEYCPPFLRSVLAMSGADFRIPDQGPCTFREFTEKLPMIAAKAKVEVIRPTLSYENPITEVQFVMFEPNKLKMVGDKFSVSLAAFAAIRESGDVVRTTVQHTKAAGGGLISGKMEDLGDGLLMIPLPSRATVTPLGIASVMFLGLGQVPDYNIVINPRNPAESFMVAFLPSGEREHYRLIFDESKESLANWVIGYTQISDDGWQRLSHKPLSILADNSE